MTNDGAHTYTYDAENRLVSVDSGTTAQYSYDYFNRRIKKVAGGATTHYVWDSFQLIAEHNGSNGAQIIDYVYSGNVLIGESSGTSFGGTNGSPTYLLSDRLSVRLMLDKNGNVTGRQAHLPFGEEFAESGSQEKHHFTSYESDAESGADYGVNRYQSTSLGRFNTMDPVASSGKMGAPQSWNRYTYSVNNPVNMRDPLGLDPFTGGGAIGDPLDDPCSPFGPDVIFDGFDFVDRFTYCFLNSGPIGSTNPGPVSKPTCADTIQQFRFGDDEITLAQFVFLEFLGDHNDGVAMVWVIRNRVWFLSQNITDTHGLGPKGGSIKDVLGYNDPNGGKQFPEYQDNGDLTDGAKKRINLAMNSVPENPDCQLLYQAYLVVYDVYVKQAPDPFADQGGSWFFQGSISNPHRICSDCVGPLGGGRLGSHFFFTFPFNNYISH